MKWINPCDFGAKGDWNTHDDDAWDAMMATLPPWQPARIYIPSGDYVFMRPWSLTRQLIVEGDGASPQTRGTRLWFYGCDGIVVPFGANNSDPNRGTFSQLKNIGLIGNQGMGIPRLTGIRMHANILVENCFIEGWTSNGITIAADANDTPPTSASCWVIRDTWIQGNLGHGIGIAGGDANVGMADHVTCVANQGFGIYDGSFLGNTYLACHTEKNALGPYYAAAAANQRSLFLGCYSEQDQPPGYVRSPSLSVGGFMAAGFTRDSNLCNVDHNGVQTVWPPFVGFTWPNGDMTLEPPFPARGLCGPVPVSGTTAGSA